MGIDFGILRDGSTITLVGEYRVSLDEDIFKELQPLFERIQLHTGTEMDLYGAAHFNGEALSTVVAELQAALKEPNEISPIGHEFLKELLRIACVAEASGKTLSYFGL